MSILTQVLPVSSQNTWAQICTLILENIRNVGAELDLSQLYFLEQEKQRTRLHCSRGFTPQHPSLCSALGDVKLGCCCSSMETHSIKRSVRCSLANQKAT